MIKTIMLAVDGSLTSKKAADYTLWLAKNINANVILFHAVDETLLRSLFSLAEGAAAPTVLDPVEQNLKEGAKVYLNAIEGQFKKENVPCETVIRGGTPAVEIVREAESRNVDLIVAGTHGRGRLGASVLGSVAYGIVHHETKIPVLLVRKEG
ncbi:MAG: Stress response protein NhaX [Syntrophus sp. PtaU1.Bin208]|nr:MAG: Stress response protein NhaX [Syntrophus sp. PtaU1.Bin208]